MTELSYADDTSLFSTTTDSLDIHVQAVGRGLPFLPRDCQGRLPVAWVKYDI